MANPFDEFDTPAVSANPFDQFDDGTHKDGFGKQLVKNFGGLATAAGDIASGIVTGIPSLLGATAATAFGDDAAGARDTAHEIMSKYSPSSSLKNMGIDMTDNPTYQYTMKPFEWISKGLDKGVEALGGGDKAKLAVEAASMMLPIPGAKYVGKGFSKVANVLDPALRDIKAPIKEAAPTTAHDILRQAKEDAARNVQGDGTMYTDSSGTTGVNQYPQGKLVGEDPAITAFAKQHNEEQAAQAVRDQNANDAHAMGDGQGTPSLFDQFDQVQGERNQFNGGDLSSTWRTDENGMPVRVDKSMEAANLEQPLQRNLFGDELGPALGNDRSLTQAIDATPKDGQWAQRRGMTNRLGGDAREVVAGSDLEAAKIAADGPKLPFDENSQFTPTNPMPYDRLGDVPAGDPRLPPPEGPPTPPVPSNDLTGTLPPPAEVIGARSGATLETSDGSMPRSADSQWMLNQTTPDTGNTKLITASRNGEVVGHLELAINPDGTASVRNVDVDPAYQRQGIASDLHDEARKQGYDIKRSQYETEAGASFRDAYDSRPVTQSATLASSPLEPLPPEQRPPVIDNAQTPRTPDTIAERATNRAVAESFPVKNGALSEWTPITTKEEALSMAKGIKDLTRDLKQRLLAPGLNMMAGFSRNPILRYASTVLRDVRVAIERDSRKYITNNDAISPMWSRMNEGERLKSMNALQAASDERMHLTPELMDKLGLGEKEKAFVTKVRESMDYIADLHNQNNTKLGFKPMEKIAGYLPSVFRGSYKSLVMHGDKVVGVIATDTKWSQKSAKDHYLKQYPDATFVEKPRQTLGGNGVRSDLFSGTNDILNMLAEHDPKFKEVQDAIALAVAQSNHKLYNFDVHELQKKGITGNKGNQPWLNKKENSEQGFKSMIQFMEDAFQYHHLQVPLKDLRDMQTAPEVAHLPRTMKYLDEYVKNVSGQGTNMIGHAINTVLDAPFAMIGVGSSIPLSMAGALKNQMSRIFMGYGNYMFTGAQMLQPFQSAAPMMKLIGDRLGNTEHVAKAMFNGNTAAVMLFLEQKTGKTFSQIPQHLREAYAYATERGLRNFSEMEKAYEGTKSRVIAAHDKFAEINMQLGESTTRTPVFLSFVDQLHSGGVPLKDALGIAENLTQAAMIDYHQWERPLGYQKLGIMGQFAGGLTTYKHGFIGQQGILAKEALKGDNVGSRNVKPMLMSAAAMLALAGVTGTPFYSELDALYGSVTDMLGEKKSIKESFLDKQPNWVNYGVVSAASGAFLQSKFSAADMIPDSIGTALSPQLAGAWKIGADAIDVAKNRDKQSVRNLALDLSPSSIKGGSENKLAKDDKGYVLDKNGKPLLYRSPEDWAKRQWLMARPMNEVATRNDTFQSTTKKMADVAAQKLIKEDYLRAFRNNNLDADKKKELLTKYLARKGNPEDLINALPKEAMEMSMDERQRAQGIPTGDFNSAMRYKYYNK
jgi:predicted GNAT family acetyltransferase